MNGKWLLPLCLLLWLFMPLPVPSAHAQAVHDQALHEQTPVTQITPAQAQQALDVLNNPQKRAEMTATLEAIIKAHPAASTPAKASDAKPGATPAPSSSGTATPAHGTAAGTSSTAGTPAPLGLPLAPDSLGAAVLVSAAGFLNNASSQVGDALRAAQGLPLLWSWVVTMATDPLGHMLMEDLAWRLSVALAGALAVYWGVRRALRRPLRVVARRILRLHPPSVVLAETESGEARAEIGEIEPPLRRLVELGRLLRRVPLVLARIGLELVPVVGFLLVGHVIVGSTLGGTSLTRLVLLAVIDSMALCIAMLRLARALLAPRHRRLRLLPMTDDAAAYAMRWTSRVLVVGVVGYAATEVGLLLGLSQAAHLALLKGVVLVEHIFVAIIVIQKRRAVRRWIRAPEGTSGAVARVRNLLAAIWHWIALFYIVSLWVVWAIAVPAGYQRLSRCLLAIVLVALVARVAITASVGAMDRLLQRATALADRYPGIDTRLSYYHPFLVSVIRLGVYVVATVLFLELMGVGTLQWLAANPLGVRILGSLSTLAITIVLALVVWETVNASIDRHLARLTREAQIARTARLRTLLPILRAGLLIAVLTVTGLMVLSEIGVNTAPLLASAGIIGVAIGFGSQKLVQDLITGLFLLLENVMQVGDWVTVSGLSGTVEHLSVRTIRLRAGDGSVHIIPFSAVTSVTNTNRGLGNAAVSVVVAHHEDTDRVCDTLRQIATEMHGTPEFSAAMLSDLQLWGIDRVDGAAVTITGQIVCTDSGRWGVQREFNRRVKKRFEELGIEMFDPTRRLLVPHRADTLPPDVPGPTDTSAPELPILPSGGVSSAGSTTR
jgi:small-conductance mechanosensitive channel